MTKAQRAKLTELQEGQVAFPPLADVKGGAIRAVLVLSHEPTRHGFPSDIEFESVIIDDQGRVVSREIAHFVRGRPR